MGLRAVILACFVLFAGVAYAEDKPWAVGVSEAEQAKALEKFKSGNEHFVKDEWRNALDAYLDALNHWDHPNIRYNAAICLIKLDRMVEAFEHMTAALRYGEAPLGKDLHSQGETYMQVLRSSVSYLEIVCKTPEGVQVTVDGQRLEKCPDTRLVRPGKHQIVSQKPGYKTETREVVTPAGGKETVVIVMQLEGTRKLTRRWAVWKPWAVVAGGAVVGLIATPLWFYTDGKFRDYNDDVSRVCQNEMGRGCADDSLIAHLDGQLSTAKRFRAITYATAAIGATGIAVGFTLVLLNTKRYSSTIVTPTVDSERAGVTITTEW